MAKNLIKAVNNNIILWLLDMMFNDNCDEVIKFLMARLCILTTLRKTLLTVKGIIERQSYHRIWSDHEEWLYRYQEIQFYGLFRMKVSSFRKLLEFILENDEYGLIKKRYRGGNYPVVPEKSLLIFLWYMSNEQTLNAIGDKFNVVEATVMKIINCFLYIIISIKSKYICWPKTEGEFEHLANSFVNYPGAIGAIDCTHIFCVVPKDQHDSYVGRYMRHSINVLGICTAHKFFIYTFIGFPGSAHDSRVFDNSLLMQNIETHGVNKYFWDVEKYHLIDDSAFPIRAWLMTPYRQTHQLNRMERRHNYCLSSDRVIIENTFGHLKGRWQRLRFIRTYSIAKAIEITTTACILHNFCLSNLDEWTGEVEEEENVQQEYRDNNFELQRLGKQKRERIARSLL